MLTRRRVLGYSALLAQGCQLSAVAQTQTPLRLAIIGNTYHYGSDLQIIADRFLVGYQHEGDWHTPNVKVVSVYIESKAHSPADLSAGRSKELDSVCAAISRRLYAAAATCSPLTRCWP